MIVIIRYVLNIETNYVIGSGNIECYVYFI